MLDSDSLFASHHILTPAFDIRCVKRITGEAFWKALLRPGLTYGRKSAVDSHPNTYTTGTTRNYRSEVRNDERSLALLPRFFESMAQLRKAVRNS